MRVFILSVLPLFVACGGSDDAREPVAPPGGSGGAPQAAGGSSSSSPGTPGSSTQASTCGGGAPTESFPNIIEIPADTVGPIACGDAVCPSYAYCSHAGSCECLPGFARDVSGGSLTCVPGKLRCYGDVFHVTPTLQTCCLTDTPTDGCSGRDKFYRVISDVSRPDDVIFQTRGWSTAFGVATREVPVSTQEEGWCSGIRTGGCEHVDNKALCENLKSRRCEELAYRSESCNATAGCYWSAPPPPAELGCDVLEQVCVSGRSYARCIERTTGEVVGRFEDGSVARGKSGPAGYCWGETEAPVDGTCALHDPTVCEQTPMEDCYTGTGENGPHACWQNTSEGTCFGTTNSCAAMAGSPEGCSEVPGCAWDPQLFIWQ